MAIYARLVFKRLILPFYMAFVAVHLDVLAVKLVSLILRRVMVERCRLPALCRMA